jgi:hypothetical protein
MTGFGVSGVGVSGFGGVGVSGFGGVGAGGTGGIGVCCAVGGAGRVGGFGEVGGRATSAGGSVGSAGSAGRAASAGSAGRAAAAGVDGGRRATGSSQNGRIRSNDWPREGWLEDGLGMLEAEQMIGALTRRELLIIRCQSRATHGPLASGFVSRTEWLHAYYSRRTSSRR